MKSFLRDDLGAEGVARDVECGRVEGPAIGGSGTLSDSESSSEYTSYPDVVRGGGEICSTVVGGGVEGRSGTGGVDGRSASSGRGG